MGVTMLNIIDWSQPHMVADVVLLVAHLAATFVLWKTTTVGHDRLPRQMVRVIRSAAACVALCGTTHVAASYVDAHWLSALAKLLGAGMAGMGATLLVLRRRAAISWFLDHMLQAARFEEFVRTSDAIGAAFVDPKTNKFLECNATFARLAGWPQEKLLNGMTFEQITSGEDVDEDVKLWGEVVEGRRKSYSMAKHYISEDGEPRPVWLTVGRLLHPVTGEITQSVSIVTDNTPAMLLAQHNEQLREAIDTAAAHEAVRKINEILGRENPDGPGRGAEGDSHGIG